MKAGAAPAVRMRLAIGEKQILTGAENRNDSSAVQNGTRADTVVIPTAAAGEKAAMAAGITTIMATGAKDTIACAAYLRDTCHHLDSAESGTPTDRPVISRRPATAADYLAMCRTTRV
jgi:hypothetical protein